MFSQWNAKTVDVRALLYRSDDGALPTFEIAMGVLQTPSAGLTRERASSFSIRRSTEQ
jgi:hypothetical protein